MTEVMYHKNIYILVDDVTLTVYKVMIFNIRSRTPDEDTGPEDRSVEKLGRECTVIFGR